MKARSTKRRRNAAELMLMGANPSQAGVAILGGAVGGATAAVVGHSLRKRLRNSIRINPAPGLRVYLFPKSDGMGPTYFDYVVQQGQQSVAHEFGNRSLTSQGKALAHARSRFPGIRRGNSHRRGRKGKGNRGADRYAIVWLDDRDKPHVLRRDLPQRALGPQLAALRRARPGQHIFWMPMNKIGQLENPADVAAMYEAFQGKPATGATEVKEPAEPDAELAQLGELRGLLSTLRGHGDLELKFSHADAVKLASNAQGTQLYFIGGDQSIDLAGLPVDAAKRYVDLGEAKDITYRAAKVHSDFQASDWVHEFGEEGGARPRLTYDRERKRLELAGGSYHVDAPGIIN